MKNQIIPAQRIEQIILEIRGQKVIIDSDIATIYGTSTKRLNEQVRRNKARFPIEFMFQLTKDEKEEVVANCDHLSNLKFSPHLPFVFTEHGALMAAAILNTDRSVQVSLFVVRAFVKLRELVVAHKELASKFNELESRVGAHDEAIVQLMQSMRQLMKPTPPKQQNKIGF